MIPGKFSRMKRNLFLAIAVTAMLSGYMINQTQIKIDTLHDSSVYLDVDGVYEKYFGDFNLSGVARQQIKTELKMIVNAVALERANGKNLAMITFISERIANQKIAEPQIREKISRLDDYLRDHKENEFQKQLLNASLLQTSNVQEYTTNCSNFVDYIGEQKKLVETFGLPYNIPNSAIQVMDLRENRFLKVNPDKSEKSTALFSADGTAKRLKLLEHFQWQPSDIILGHTQSTDDRFSVQGYWNHAGIYSERHKRIIDVWPQETADAAGGVRKSSLAFWAEHFSDIAVVRINDIPLSTRKTIEAHITRRLGEPYNLTTHKMNPSGGWYCSKLVYWGYLQEGIDLDSGGGVSVLPDDLAFYDDLGSLTCLTPDTL